MRHTLPVVLMTLLAAAPALAQTPAAAPSAPLRIGGQTKAPERIHYVAPAYPAVAMAARVSGTVIIEATIDKEGSVTEARVLRSIATLDQAALNAVKQWKYKPTTIDGSVAGSTGSTLIGSVCQAKSWPSSARSVPSHDVTLQKCSRTRACS